MNTSPSTFTHAVTIGIIFGSVCGVLLGLGPLIVDIKKGKSGLGIGGLDEAQPGAEQNGSLNESTT